MKKTVLSALLLGAAVFAASPSEAQPHNWQHPHAAAHPRAGFHPRAGIHPHARFAFHHDFRHFTPAEHRSWGRRPLASHALAWPPGLVVGRRRCVLLLSRTGLSVPVEVSTTYYDEARIPTNQGGYDQGGDDQSGPDDQAGPDDQGGGYGTWYHCNSPEAIIPTQDLPERLGGSARAAGRHAGWPGYGPGPNDQGPPQGYDDQAPPPPPR